MYSLLCFVAGSSFSSSSIPNFPNCSSPRESASVFADYLRSHFSVFHPKALRSRATGSMSELHRATCPKESQLSFCFPFFPTEFHAAASNLSSATATGPDKVAYPVPSTLLAVAWIFSYTFSIFSGHCIPFLPSGRHLPLFPSTRWENLFTLLLPSGLSLSPPVSQSFLNASLYLAYYFFWSLISFSLPARPVSVLDDLLSIKFCSFLSPFQTGLTNPGWALEILATINYSKAFDSLSDTPLLFTNLFWVASVLALFIALLVTSLLNLSLLIGVLARFFEITKSCSVRVRRGVPKESVLGPVLFSLFINNLSPSLPSSVSCSLYADNLAIWSSSPRSLMRCGGHTRCSNSSRALV